MGGSRREVDGGRWTVDEACVAEALSSLRLLVFRSAISALDVWLANSS
jgi:hypothetical protein